MMVVTSRDGQIPLPMISSDCGVGSAWGRMYVCIAHGKEICIVGGRLVYRLRSACVGDDLHVPLLQLRLPLGDDVFYQVVILSG